MSIRLPFTVAWLTVLATLSSPLLAHDIAIFPRAEEAGVRLQVRYGHPGDYQDTLGGKLVTLDAFAPDGQRRSLAGRLRPDGLSLVTAPLADAGAPGTWLFAAFYDNGFFLRTEDGRSVNTTRAEYPAASAVSHNIKYGKALFASAAPGPGFDRVVGHRLEIVPKQNPLGLGRGGTLDVVVHFDGRPLAGASLFVYPASEADKPVESKTDATGAARVTLDRTGVFILGTEHGVPSRHPEFATRDVYAATLVFTLP